ncbi:MAG: superoxide dismutase family protein [Aromatoleum sp.]|uniref:superoxide dismutase family protein n=1 Tax=Aromatoleum sp. TaxID=2307007 RepID=UPI0028940679|nr:superoxide dismutase family protein [Aromatoleum sp.]MDT3671050.1 superoxide dismutase family protein [Aromatoleum sp.]
MNTRLRISTLLASALFAATGNAIAQTPGTAEASLAPTQGNKTAGKVSFTQADGGVRIEAHVTGLTPGGHGFHLHEKGDCSAPDATSAGGHFNPTKKAHGHPDKGEHHLGDLPMLEADAKGEATLTTVVKGVSIGEGENGIVGRAVIVHAAPDDYKTQPTGNSGGRVACGVIQAK